MLKQPETIRFTEQLPSFSQIAGTVPLMTGMQIGLL